MTDASEQIRREEADDQLALKIAGLEEHLIRTNNVLLNLQSFVINLQDRLYQLEKIILKKSTP